MQVEADPAPGVQRSGHDRGVLSLSLKTMVEVKKTKDKSSKEAGTDEGKGKLSVMPLTVGFFLVQDWDERNGSI